MLFMLFFWLFSAAYAEEPNASMLIEEKMANYQVIQIYVDITEIHTPDGTVGTSMPLNIMMSEEAQNTSILENRMHRHTGAEVWEGEINVYDWKNVQYMPTFKKCDYRDAVKCGIQNGHWTLRTIVSVGDKYSIFTAYLYDERGQVIASSDQTAWGTIRWVPQWKLTTIKEQSAFGAASKQIFEQWPPRMEEIPPLITPTTISQASFGFYWVKKTACRTTACKK
tara:strand:+ start:224 stop:895 length:672 start_codon:yes stop_codon:yes gene_type:complete